MTPKICHSPERKLVGMRLHTSLAPYRVVELWQRFMPHRKLIEGNLNQDLVSMAIYPLTYFADFKPTNEFERWATVEVADFEAVPENMETYVLPAGLYAVFDYKGSATNYDFFQYIFATWLPQSDYVLDNRPHFEILGEKYKKNDPDSEEEIWIPIAPKNPNQ